MESASGVACAVAVCSTSPAAATPDYRSSVVTHIPRPYRFAADAIGVGSHAACHSYDFYNAGVLCLYVINSAGMLFVGRIANMATATDSRSCPGPIFRGGVSSVEESSGFRLARIDGVSAPVRPDRIMRYWLLPIVAAGKVNYVVWP
jgi:hypothetical protein